MMGDKKRAVALVLGVFVSLAFTALQTGYAGNRAIRSVVAGQSSTAAGRCLGGALGDHGAFWSPLGAQHLVRAVVGHATALSVGVPTCAQAETPLTEAEPTLRSRYLAVQVLSPDLMALRVTPTKLNGIPVTSVHAHWVGPVAWYPEEDSSDDDPKTVIV